MNVKYANSPFHKSLSPVSKSSNAPKGPRFEQYAIFILGTDQLWQGVRWSSKTPSDRFRYRRLRQHWQQQFYPNLSSTALLIHPIRQCINIAVNTASYNNHPSPSRSTVLHHRDYTAAQNSYNWSSPSLFFVQLFWQSTLSSFSFSCSGSLHSSVFRSAVLVVYTLLFFVQHFWQSTLSCFSFSCSGSLHSQVFLGYIYIFKWFSNYNVAKSL